MQNVYYTYERPQPGTQSAFGNRAVQIAAIMFSFLNRGGKMGKICFFFVSCPKQNGLLENLFKCCVWGQRPKINNVSRNLLFVSTYIIWVVQPTNQVNLVFLLTTTGLIGAGQKI